MTLYILGPHKTSYHLCLQIKQLYWCTKCIVTPCWGLSVAAGSPEKTRCTTAQPVQPFLQPASPLYRSLGLFSEGNRFQLLCLKIIASAYFEGVILLLVLLSSIVLGLNSPCLQPLSQPASPVYRSPGLFSEGNRFRLLCLKIITSANVESIILLLGLQFSIRLALNSPCLQPLSQFASPLYRSLGLFSEGNRFRLLCLRIITSAYFEGVILLLVLLSSIMLALNSPSLQPYSTLDDVISICDLVFVACFALEMCMKVRV